MLLRISNVLRSAALVAAVAAPAGAATIDCSQPPFNGVISGDVEANVFVPSDTNCWIQSSAHVTGNVDFADGNSVNFHVLLIEGTVDGNVTAIAPTSGGGLPLIRLSGTINGNVHCLGASAAFDTVGEGPTVNGNVRADNWRVGLFGHGTTINGNIRCGGVGDGGPDQSLGIFNTDVTINGNIRLLGSGNAVLGSTASVWVDGAIRCEGAGSDSNIPLSSVSGHKFGCPTQ